MRCRPLRRADIAKRTRIRSRIALHNRSQSSTPGRTSPAGRLEGLRRSFEPVTQRLETNSGIGHRALRQGLGGQFRIGADREPASLSRRKLNDGGGRKLQRSLGLRTARPLARKASRRTLPQPPRTGIVRSMVEVVAAGREQISSPGTDRSQHQYRQPAQTQQRPRRARQPGARKYESHGRSVRRRDVYRTLSAKPTRRGPRNQHKFFRIVVQRSPKARRTQFRSLEPA